jgi:hypothetical protein
MVLPCPPISEVWVASGVYVPSADSAVSIPMRNGVAVYGGFDGTETARSQRDWVANETIFSGEIGAAVSADNSEHVVDASGCDSTAVLDGVVISDGHAAREGSIPHTRGGGVRIDGGNPTFRNVVFRDNFGWVGAAVVVENGAEPTFINPIAYDNEALYRGGFMLVVGASPTIVNGTVAGNTSPIGGTIRTQLGGTTTIVNTIVWGSGLAIEQSDAPPLVSYSLIEGSGGSGAGWNADFGTDGGGNIDADPSFVDMVGRDLHLMPSSPAIDAGDGAANALEVDADGNPRVVSVIDMGAYESDVETAVPEATFAGQLRAYPNPFNPSVTIKFSVPGGGDAELIVSDVTGRLVRSFHRRHVVGPVTLKWDGTDESGRRVPSGIYFARLRSEGFSRTVKLVVIK